jgi:hypothetical protein
MYGKMYGKTLGTQCYSGFSPLFTVAHDIAKSQCLQQPSALLRTRE